jgi:transposase
MVNAMLWIHTTGAQWRDLPERSGPWQSVATRFYRWVAAGVILRAILHHEIAAKVHQAFTAKLHQGVAAKVHHLGRGARPREQVTFL